MSRLNICLLSILALFAIQPFAQADDAGDPLVKRAAEHVQKGRHAEAQEVLDLLVSDDQLPPQDFLKVTLLASQLEEETGHPAKALEVIDDALNGHDHLSTLWARKAELLWKRGQNDSSLAAVRKSLDLNSQELLARYVAGHLALEAGSTDEAIEQFRWFVRHYNRTQPRDCDSLILIARGAAEYGRLQTVPEIFRFIVNTLCPDALKDNPDCWQASLISGELLLEKYNREQAVPEFHSALKINPQCAPALTGLAQAAMYDFDVDDADGFADKALEIDPSHLQALLIKIDVAIYRDQLDTSRNLLSQAQKINPASQQLLARKLAIEILQDQQVNPDQLLLTIKQELSPAGGDVLKTEWQRTLRTASQNSSKPGLLLATAGELLESRRHLDKAEILYRQAIEVMPQLAAPRTSLGLLCMRNGRIEEAEEILDAAFKADPFHVRVSNMRKVLGVLKEYETISTEHFVIRIDASEKVLGREMADYLERIYPELTEKYDYEPPTRTQFEVYSDAKGQPAHAWFSARMIGLPWIQTIGASTGMIVALASPSKTEQPYNWARVLRHEFVHILTLQRSRFQIPHWYTEALAVTEEQMSEMPDRWEELLLARVPNANTFDLKSINLGFQKPGTQDDWHLAYCQSWLYAQYITGKFGPDGLARLLAAYEQTAETESALRLAFNVPLDEFETGYRELLTSRTESLKGGRPERPPGLAAAEELAKAQPDDPDVLSQLAHSQLLSRRFRSAMDTAEKVLAIRPDHPLARSISAAGALAERDVDKAVTILDDVLKQETPPPLTLELRAAMAERSGDNQLAETLILRLIDRYPRDLDYQSDLLRVSQKLGRDDAGLKANLERVAQQETDNAAVRKRLARLSASTENWPETVSWAEQAIQIDILDDKMHRLLAEHADQAGRPERAIFSYLALIDLGQATTDDKLALARLYVRNNRRDSARDLLRDILASDPDRDDARTMFQQLDQAQ